jgi:hypothetical protein
MMICIDDVDGPFVIVLVALLAVCDLNVPTQVIVKDSSAQTEHLLKQVGMPCGVMRFNDDSGTVSRIVCDNRWRQMG